MYVFVNMCIMCVCMCVYVCVCVCVHVCVCVCATVCAGECTQHIQRVVGVHVYKICKHIHNIMYL